MKPRAAAFCAAIALAYSCAAASTAGEIDIAAGSPASAFTESVGIGASFSKDPAENRYVISLLQAAKIRHIRGADIQTMTEGWYGPGNRQAYIDFYDTLSAAGIRSTLLTTSDYNAHTVQTPAVIAAALGAFRRGTIEALEAPNELDSCCGDAGWPADDATMLQRLWDLVHARNSPFSGLAIIGPSLAHGDYLRLGDESASEDFANLHDYQAGFMPETSGWGGRAPYSGPYGYGALQFSLANARRSCPACKVVVTEAGYGKRIPSPNSIPESVEAAWVPRLYLWSFMNGVARTYPWLIGPRKAELGVVRADLTQRPGYRALAGLMKILSGAEPARTCAYPLRILGDVRDVQAVAFCKAGGEVALVLWIAAQDFDTNKQVATPVAAQTVAIVPGSAPARTLAWSFGDDGAWAATQAPNLAAFAVTTHPQIVVFNAAGPARLGPLPAAPAIGEAR